MHFFRQKPKIFGNDSGNKYLGTLEHTRNHLISNIQCSPKIVVSTFRDMAKCNGRCMCKCSSGAYFFPPVSNQCEAALNKKNCYILLHGSTPHATFYRGLTENLTFYNVKPYSLTHTPTFNPTVYVIPNPVAK